MYAKKSLTTSLTLIQWLRSIDSAGNYEIGERWFEYLLLLLECRKCITPAVRAKLDIADLIEFKVVINGHKCHFRRDETLNAQIDLPYLYRNRELDYDSSNNEL